jgi:hypothetical protein
MLIFSGFSYAIDIEETTINKMLHEYGASERIKPPESA